MKQNDIKISFLGDIMCELPLLRAYRHYGKKVFDKLFENCSNLLSESDFVIGNLETVCAGEKEGFTKELYSFNTPDEFLDALKDSQIDMVLLANNHCFDRGESGLKRTILQLKDRGIQYTGADFKEDGCISKYLTIKGTNISIFSLTQSTNYFSNRVLASETNFIRLNILRDNNRNVYSGKIYPPEKPVQKKRLLSEESRIRLKKLLGRTYNKERSDDFIDEGSLQPYLNEMSIEIQKCKEGSDIVIVCPHMGGQFNSAIGKFSSYMMNWFVSQGVDAVIASHPHIVQQADVNNGIPKFYSLGNFSMSPTSVYLLFEGLPQYGIIAHLYISNKKIVRTTFSVVKIKEEAAHQMRVIPVDEIKNLTEIEIEEITTIVNKVKQTTYTQVEIQREYELM